jgi:hypothetical protein
MWEPGYDPHHPLCGWFIVKRRCPVPWIHENYPGTRSWVKPDTAALTDDGSRLREGTPIIRGADGHSLMPNTAVRDNKAELWLGWYKNDRTPKSRETGKELELRPEQRYLSCANGCGYRSPLQGELLKQGKLERELPEELEGCPDCEALGQAGILKRVDRRAEEEQVLAYSRGKRLVIIAPFSAAPDDEPVYDGKWPIPRARSFPGLFLTSYLSPRRPMGKSDVTLMWDQQLAADNLRTMILQRVFENRNYWELPAAGITDYRGGRFNFRDDQFNVMYRDASKATMGPLDVRIHNAAALDTASWQAAFGVAQQALTAYRGKEDYGLTPDATKNIAVGTVERLTQQANIPIEEYNRRKNQELSKWYGVISDMIHATYTPQRLTRLNIDGMDLLVELWGEDMPNFDFVVEETPEFAGLEKARSEAFNALLQVIPMAATLGIPADRLIEIFADINNLPRSVVRKLQKELEAVRVQQEQAAEQAMAAAEAVAGGGGDMPLPNPLEEIMGGLNGGGMEPAPVA